MPPAPSRRRPTALLVAAVLAVAGAVLVVVAALGGGPPAPAAETGPLDTGAVGAVGTVPADARPAGAVLPPSPPASISIPAIGVESVVNEVGLAPDGTLEVPQPGPLYDQAAWYRGSAAPGFRGPSVILGHVDSAAEGPSVFYDLGRIKPGQEIVVKRDDGIAATFRVDDVRSFPKDAFPSQSVYGATDRAELRLITCSGSFAEDTGSYRDNTIVFAHLVGSAGP
ncbi:MULTISPECIES: class F sortase [unclassified Pseudonocardia]|uniref:class F sortase n=1 Tax=unclassified Pseudonocardia TaxID=2619320 RepID=UPI0001FFEF64|nr:class F sortase [Pseudonocardia sp. Ae707_Ps1]OLM20125.1 putative secreted protein [Pseudonocardia sp. Ae707_Ps1]